MAENAEPNAQTGPLKPKADIGVELGVSSILPVGDFSSFYGSTGSDGELLHTSLVPIDELVLMRRRDGHARSLMRLLTLPILKSLEGAKWVLPDDAPKPENPDDPDAPVPGQEEVDFANAMFFSPPQNGGMTAPLSKVLRQTLLAFSDGFSVFEEVRYVPRTGPLKGKIVLKKLAYRDPRTIRFHVDETGGFNGVRQVTSFMGRTVDVRIPKEKCWTYACYGEENPFYGVSLFESAYTHYDIKRKLYYLAHIAAQFAATPARIGEFPANADPQDLAAFRTALQSFAMNTAMMHPHDYKVTMQSTTSNFDFLKLIDHHNHMMSQSVLAGFLDSSSRPSLVEFNEGDPEADMFVLSLQAVMHELAESWTYHLMPKYIDWNFASHIYPRFQFGNLTEEDRSAIMEAFKTVITASVLNATPEFVREVEKNLARDLKLGINYEEIEEKEKAAAEQAQALQGLLGGAPPVPGEEAPPGALEEAAAQPGGAPATTEGALAPSPEPVPPAPVEPPPVAPAGPVVAASMPELDDLIRTAQALLTYEPDSDFSDMWKGESDGD